MLQASQPMLQTITSNDTDIATNATNIGTVGDSNNISY